MTQGDATINRMLRAIPLSRGVSSSDFDLNPEGLPATASLTPAAVLVPLIARKGRWQVILTRRAAALKHHPGQVAFPGGKCDPGDKDDVATALREANEEIGLNSHDVDILGTAGHHITVTGFSVTPVLGVVSAPFEGQPEAGEVERIFEVPLEFLLDQNTVRVEKRRWHGTFRHYYVIPWGPFYIWGATARMIVALREAWEKAG